MGKKVRGDVQCCWFFMVILITHKWDVGLNQSNRHAPSHAPSPAPCSALLPHPSLSVAWQSFKGWGAGPFLFQTASDRILMWCFSWDLCSPYYHPCTREWPVKPCSSLGTSGGSSSGCWRVEAERSHPADALHLHRAVESCDETSGEKSKVNSRFTGVQFTSLNCFPPSSALPPSGKCFSKSTCWNSKKTNEF